MRKKGDEKIIHAIDQARESKSEKDFLDFKEKWCDDRNKEDKADLIHDILALSNCDYKDDRYLVVGIEDKTFSVKCIKNDQNRRNTADLTSLMRDSCFNKIPNIEVQEILYQNSVLDVVIIKYDNSHTRPFYIEKLTSALDKKLSAGAIYSRNNDTNTPKNSTANKFEIEKMWREHFGIDKSALERFKIYLEKPEDWEKCDGVHYYKYFPEFKIVYPDPEGNGQERSSYLKIDNPPASGENRYIYAPMSKVILQYHSTKMYEVKLAQVYWCINHDYTTGIAHPDSTFFDQSGLFDRPNPSGKYLFFFIFEESFLYRISKFLIEIEKESRKISDGVFCWDVSEFDPDDKFIFVLKGDDKKDSQNIGETIKALSQDSNKMKLIKSDPRFVWP